MDRRQASEGPETRLSRWDERLCRLLTPTIWLVPAVWRYVLAAFVAVAAAALRRALTPWMGAVTPYNFLVVTAVISTLWLGMGPGLLCVLVGDLAVEILVVSPSGLGAGVLGRMGPNIAIGVFVSYLLRALRLAQFRTRSQAAKVLAEATDRQLTEEALRESEERLRAAFMASPDAININRLRDGAYVAVNERFEQLSLWPRAEVMGRTIVDLNVWVDLEERDRLLTRLLSSGSGSVQNAETAFRRRDGSTFTASISAQVFEAKGERFLLAITRDISAMKRAEQKLREADRHKDEFLGMLSHELRNPLAPIRNSLYVLDHVDPSSQQARRAKEIASRQIAHLARLVDDLLDVTRIARGKFGLRRCELDLGALARRTAEDHRALMEDRRVAFAVEVQERPVVVNGDETRLAEVLGNLLHNAAKFTHPGGRVTLTVAEEQGEAVVHVRDTGTGIAPEVLPTIFEPFTQAKQTLARSEGGLGLGLALVKGLVEMHGGSVSAASDGLGKGTTFTFTLPLGVTAAQVIPARPSLGVTATPRRVLVIEDNHDAADILREVLELKNHVVDVAYSGRDGIEKARAFHPDVVLCDIGLPEMDGYEVARTLRADHELGRVALIAVSGYAQPQDVAMAKEAGFDAHLAKPPSIDTLERALAEVGREGAPAVDLRGEAGV
jgi:PAS domain S-box-containing protein